mgnify:CR=1 FL=1
MDACPISIYKPAKVAKSLTPYLRGGLNRCQLGTVKWAAREVHLHHQWTLKHLQPATTNLVIAPVCGLFRTELKNNMVMIAHNGVSTNINGEDRA